MKGEMWESLQEKLKTMEENENEELCTLFNNLIEPYSAHDDLGDILFGDFESFKTRIDGLEAGNQQIYTDALQEHGIVQI